MIALIIAAFAIAALLVGQDVPPSSTPAPAVPPRPLREKSPTRLAFVNDMRAAMSNVDMRGIPQDLALVVFDLETGTGRGDVFVNTNNPGSISAAVGWTDKPSYKGKRVYATLEDGIRDFVRLMSEVDRYKKTYAAMTRRDFKGSFYELERAGYEVSIDPPYSTRLNNRLVAMRKESVGIA